MFITIEILYAAFCIWFARCNAKRIIADKRIYHGWNGLIHLAVAATCFYFFRLKGLAMLFVARLFFDAALNYFRFGHINYVAAKPKSIADKIEKFVFHSDKYLAMIIEVFVLIILNAL